MRIAHIITRLIIGGAQENTLLSCRGQHQAGHEVTLITGPPSGPEGSLLQPARADGYRIIVAPAMRRALNPLRDFIAYRELVRLLRELQPQIVHTHSSKAGILGRRAARAARVPAIVHTVHGLAFTASTHVPVNALYRNLERIAAPWTTRIVCVADAMRDQSLAAGIGKPEQYVTIYSGMKTDPFVHPPRPRDQVRREWGIADDHLVIGTIARLFDLKGHDDLLAIAPDLCARFPHLRFLWVGDGTRRAQFEAEMNRLALRDRFILTGMVPPPRVPELCAAMDLLVHPSRREGLARALPQAQLAGIPVITYDIDGNREGLLDTQTGLVIPPFDRKKLADAIISLASDAGLRTRMGHAGRDFALARFDAKIMVQQLDQLYRQIA